MVRIKKRPRSGAYYASRGRELAQKYRKKYRRTLRLGRRGKATPSRIFGNRDIASLIGEYLGASGSSLINRLPSDSIRTYQLVTGTRRPLRHLKPEPGHYTRSRIEPYTRGFTTRDRYRQFLRGYNNRLRRR